MMTLKHALCAETFSNTERLLRREAGRFARKYNVDSEELFSEACWKFLHVYGRDDFNPDQAEFSSWLILKVRWHLADYLRTKFKQPQMAEIPETIPAKRGTFSLAELLDELSPAAKKLVSATLNTPTDVLLSLDKHEKFTKWRIRRALKRYLRDLGWSLKKIRAAFQEVEEAL